jgi:hypothetical protein
MFTAAVTIYSMGQRSQALQDRIDNMDHYGTAVEQQYRGADEGRWEQVHLDLATIHEDLKALDRDQKKGTTP